eukprot:m.98230 g.98230  ORF g.98230 m.98230 type:complete len:300 (-) comp27045_c0_seq1:135-1034(-)
MYRTQRHTLVDYPINAPTMPPYAPNIEDVERRSILLHFLWTFLMFFVGGTSVYSYLTPEWVVKKGEANCGLIKFCQFSDSPTQIQFRYLTQSPATSSPSISPFVGQTTPPTTSPTLPPSSSPALSNLTFPPTHTPTASPMVFWPYSDCTWPYHNYGVDIVDIPGGMQWQSASIFICVGSGVCSLMAFTSLLTLCKPSYNNWVQNIFIFGAGFFFIGIFLVLLGFGELASIAQNATELVNTTEPTFQCKICGASAVFSLDIDVCEMGTSMILALVSAVVSVCAVGIGHCVTASTHDKKQH